MQEETKSEKNGKLSSKDIIGSRYEKSIYKSEQESQTLWQGKFQINIPSSLFYYDQII